MVMIMQLHNAAKVTTRAPNNVMRAIATMVQLM